MKTIWILKGLPSSGKSTWAKEKVAKSNCSIVRVNKDDLRSMLHSSKHSKGNEKFVIDVRDSIIRRCLNRGVHIIVDDTNLHPKHEEAIRTIAKEYGAIVKIKHFVVSPEECIERDLKRPNSVGAKVIWNMYNKYLKSDLAKECENKVFKQDESLPHAIICDLDGTVAFMNGRSPYDGDKVDTDLPNQPVITLVEQYLWSLNQGSKEPTTKVIFLSGREDSCREKTIEWIKKHIQLKDNEWELLMRKTGDNRRDSIVKKMLFDVGVKDKYYIDYVLDDRNQVVELWRSLGLTCLQVADGNF